MQPVHHAGVVPCQHSFTSTPASDPTFFPLSVELTTYLSSAVEPSAVEFTGKLLGAAELLASAAAPEAVTCQALDARPKAELRWFLGDRQLTEGVTDDEETNPDSKLITSRSTLTHQFEREDEGAELRCVAKHPAFGEQEERQAALSVMVQCEYRVSGGGGGDVGVTASCSVTGWQLVVFPYYLG